MFIVFSLLIILFWKLLKKIPTQQDLRRYEWVIKLLLLLFLSVLAGYWTIFCSNSIPMAVNGGVKKCSHACGGRIHSLQSSDFCSDWDTSSQPTHCRNIHLSYLQIFSRAFFSRISCQTLLFPLSLKPSRCPYRELSGRLVDAKLPLSSGRNRWLLKHFSYLLIVSDTTRVRLDCVCTVTLTIINTFWTVSADFFSLSVLQLRCHRDTRQQVLAFRSH